MNVGKAAVVTVGGYFVVSEKRDEDDWTELEVREDVRIGEEVIEVRSVVKVGVNVESVMVDVSGEVGGNVGGVAPVNVGVMIVMGVSESVVGSDKEDGAKGSIVIESRELEANTVPGSVGRVSGVEASVMDCGRVEGSPGVRVIVSGVPVFDGNASVAVGSLVSVIVIVNDRLISKDVDREKNEEDDDEEESVDVCDRNVGSISSSRVENGESTPVRLKGSSVGRAVSGSISSSLMRGVEVPQDGRQRASYMGAVGLAAERLTEQEDPLYSPKPLSS